MKRLLSIVYLSVVVVAAASATEAIHISRKSDETGVIECECRFRRNRGWLTTEFGLFGKVRFVTDDGDIRVYVARPNEISDLVVEWVDHPSIVCGEWQWVDSDEKFTVQVVTNPQDADIIIEYGDSDFDSYTEPCWNEY